MQKDKKGFSFVELIVGISISTVLMLGVGVFVSNGMKNISIQKQILNSDTDLGTLYNNLDNVFGVDYKVVKDTGSGILINSNFKFGKGNFTYIGTKTFTGECENEPDLETKYLSFDNFTPFESEVIAGFSGDSINHVVYSGTNIVAGKSIFGNDFSDGSLGTGVYLNNSTGVAFGDNKLFISDTANNRILYLSGSRIYKLLDETNNIKTPTGLYFTGKTLFISNSGNNEVLKYSFGSGGISVPNLNLNFTPEATITGTGIKISFFSGSNLVSVTGPTNTGSFTFSSNIAKNLEDSVNTSGNILNYNFTGSSVVFNSGNNYGIEVSSITGNFTVTGTYYAKLEILNGSTLNYEKYFPYFVRGDDKIETTSDNVLEIFTGSLSYPTGIYASGSDLVVNDYLSRNWIKLSSTGSFISSGNLTPIDYNAIPYNENTTKLSNFKIKDFSYSTGSNLINFKIDYYKYFSCENPDENIVKTIIYKKKIN